MELRIKKLRDDAVIPVYGSDYSAGADLYAADGAVIAPGKTAMVHTGLAMEIPAGYVGLVYARSGLAMKRGIAPANKVGVVDADYRGEIMIALYNHSGEAQTIEKGERVAQIIIAPFVRAEFSVAEELSDTGRGAGGFGSTGRL